MTGVERDQWGSKAEFLLASAGSIVGLGNIWRFPYLCYKNGGGAFLVPYLLFVVVCGIPLFLLETMIGQFTQQGIVTCWRKICPLAQGIGYAELVILCYGTLSYLTILAWALFYLVFSFSSQLPWASCGHSWNTENCIDFTSLNQSANWTYGPNSSSAATEFWEQRVLAISGGIEEVGSVRWELMLCLIACSALCYFSIWKGVKSTGKVVYFTATFPYVMLLVLLIRGLTLPGAWKGIHYYLVPDPDRLADPQVWMEAGTQIFLSYSIGSGQTIVLGSFNQNKYNSYKDCIWLCLLNSATSFVSGFAIFSVIGFMAEKQGVPINAVAESGPGLAFIAYPQAVAMMPIPHFWTFCFFFMVLLLGVDSEFVMMESIITTVTDLFPMLLRKARRREVFVLVFCLVCFPFQLTFITEGGIYVFQLIDYYACSGAGVLFMTVFECLVIGWIFGVDQFYDIIKQMTGQQPCVFFKLCWCFLTPLLSLGCFIFYLVDHRPLRFNRWYVYPDWAYALGWTLTLSCIVMVPVWGIYMICASTGSLRQRLSILCRSAHDPFHQQRTTENPSRHEEML
uniref:sodium- and chloride-dependent GABA transporter 2-like n=1 Tax=Centroberyx gerrardi TaxID=166262 RepID=UPI003AB03861